MENLVNDPNELWEKRLNNLFQKKEKTEVEKFLDIVSIIVYSNDVCSDITDLYSILDLENFIKVVNLFSGRTIHFPEKNEIKSSIELALFYYYKKIKNVNSYSDLKDLHIVDDKDFSSVSIGKKIKKLDEKLQQKLFELILELDDE